MKLARHADALSYLLDDIDAHHGLSVATGYVNLAGIASCRRCGRRRPAGPAADRRDPRARPRGTASRLAIRADPRRAAPGPGSVPLPAKPSLSQLIALDSWLDRPRSRSTATPDASCTARPTCSATSTTARAALVTSANLTGAGLFRNLELGLVQYDPPVAGQALAWFDRLWGEAEEFKAELRELLFPEIGLVSPRTVYLRALLELLDAEVDEPPGPLPGAVDLAPFQRDGFNRALRILNRHHGVIYADGVGTGKTEIGLALIEEYSLRRGLHALVVAPAQLVEHWNERLSQCRLPAQVVSFHQLAADEQLAAPDLSDPRRHLHSDKDVYRLVVVDEGHALRTPGTTWYRAISRLLGGVQKDLALLTATPINNGLWDLYHLVMAFARHDRAFAAHGIPSLRRLFVSAGANERDIENLDPDVLFQLADLVSVRRDRRFIERHYPNETFPDGTPVSFPTPKLSTERYDLDTAFPRLVQIITTSLARLTMARYRPSAHRLHGDEAGREAALGALLQSAVLKRFESCWHACLLTITRMIAAHDAFLTAWDSGWVLTGKALLEVVARDLDESGLAGWLEDDLDEARQESTDDFKPTYREHVAADRALLAGCAEALARLDSEGDPKLALLRRLLTEVPSHKVIVFLRVRRHRALPARAPARARRRTRSSHRDRR